MSFDEIRFDMSHEGLTELSAILEPLLDRVSPELQNFTNVVRNLKHRVAPAAQEPSWLDE